MLFRSESQLGAPVASTSRLGTEKGWVAAGVSVQLYVHGDDWMEFKQAESDWLFSPLVLIAPFFLWGTAMVAMKGVIPDTTPLFLAGIRIVPAGFLVLLFAFLRGRSQPQGWRAWLWILGFAGIDGALFQGFLAEGLVRTGAGLGSVLIDSQPIAVALLALWLFGEQIGLWGWLGLGLGLVGVSLLGLPDAWVPGLLRGEVQFGVQDLFQQGEGLMLLAALAMAVGTIMLRLVARHADPVVATGWHMVLGGLPLFALSWQVETEQWAHLTWTDWTALGYSTIFGSAIAYGLFFYFASKGNLTSLSALTFFTPVFALLFGHLFLNEVLSPMRWCGVGLTLISIYLINRRHLIAQRWLAWRSQGFSGATLQPVVTSLRQLVTGGHGPSEVPVEALESEPKS